MNRAHVSGISRLVLGIFTYLLFINAGAEKLDYSGVAATIQKIAGVVHIRRENSSEELAFEGMHINAGATVITEQESSVFMIFSDKSQLALRPNSEFRIKAFHYDESKSADDSLVIALLKGGLRTISGFVGKRGNRDAYRLESANATMGIRGTDYMVRLCGNDCADEQDQHTLVSPAISGVIGRVAKLTGKLSRRNQNQLADIKKMAAIFENDELLLDSNGYAILVLTDGTSIILTADSSIKINKYYYDETQAEAGELTLKMVKGAMRINIGQIGNINSDKVQVIANSASIAIKEGIVDLVCGHDRDNLCSGELFVAMRDGKSAIQSGNQVLEMNAEQLAFIPKSGNQPTLTSKIPQAVMNLLNLIPDYFDADIKSLFGIGDQKIAPGLYAAVNDGKIELTNENSQSIEINRGETGYSTKDNGLPTLMPVTPAFLGNDDTLGQQPFIQGLCSSN